MMRGVLSEGFMSGMSLCPDGVMYRGGFIRRGFYLGFHSVSDSVSVNFQLNSTRNTLFHLGTSYTVDCMHNRKL